MNFRAVAAIYKFEMARTWRTILQSIVSPVVSTSLYFVVFGAAIGSRISEVEGVSYGTFIVPGLVMLSVLTQSIANASFGIYFPKFVGTIYEILSAPASYLEIVLGYVGAAATKSIILGLIILGTAGLFVPLHIMHPVWMLAFLVLTAVTFSLFGFIIGIWADGFEKLQMIPMLVVTPLTFLGGSFYSVNMLPSGWRTITLLNPVVYLISGFRWSFYEIADVSVALRVGLTLGFLTALARLYGSRPLVSLARFYVWIIRGTPLLVQLFVIFYGLPSVGILLDAFPAALIGFTLNVGAYSSEIVRAVIASIPKGQWEASYSIGMNWWQALRRTVLPQAARTAVPPLSNTFISLVKDTSLAAAVTVPELFQAAQRIVATTYEPLIIYIEAALIYLALSSVLSALQDRLERRLARSSGLAPEGAR